MAIETITYTNPNTLGELTARAGITDAMAQEFDKILKGSTDVSGIKELLENELEEMVAEDQNL